MTAGNRRERSLRLTGPRAPDPPGIGRAFILIAMATAILLLIPYAAMQVTDEVNWSPGDFVVMGGLLLGAGSIHVLLARRLPKRWRPIAGLVVVVLLLYVWAELAVGVFTGAGS